MEKCPFCGADPRAQELPGPMNQNPPTCEFYCGSTYFSKTDLYQSWACKELANLKALVRETVYADNRELKEILSRPEVKKIMEGKP